MRMTIDLFLTMKKKHGKLMAFTICEGSAFKTWKHEYGYPGEFHALLFFDGTVWDAESGER